MPTTDSSRAVRCRSRRAALALSLVVTLAACPGERGATADTAAVPADTASATDVLGCDARGARLTGDGLGALRVGATLASVRQACRIVRDTVAEGPEAQLQRELTIALATDTVTAIVVDDAIWRVHVDDPDIRTADDLGVGTPASAFRSLDGAQVMFGEGVFVAVPSICGLSFRLSEDADAGTLAGTPDASRVAALPASARVVEVLAVGCPIRGS